MKNKNKGLFFLITLFLFGSAASLPAQEIKAWRFNNIVHGFAGQPDTRTYTVTGPEVKKLDASGGELWFYLTPKSHPDCKQLFRVGWNFEKSMQELVEGQSYNVQVFNLLGGGSQQYMPCYAQAKGWAYDGGFFIVDFTGGAANHFHHNPQYAKYWGPESQYLFALNMPKGTSVYPLSPGYEVPIGTNIGSLFVKDGPHAVGTANAPHGSFCFEISKGGLFKYTVMYMYDGMQGPLTTNDDIGAQWIVGESGWLGIWNRRGNSNIFDATWYAGDSRITAEMIITVSGNQVTIQRRKSSDGNDCTYTGTLSADGRNVVGTYGCTYYPGPFYWSARIVKRDQIMFVD